jgi:hypothetical protein
MTWYSLPDPVRHPPTFDVRRVGVRQALGDEIAGPEFQVNEILLRHTDLWTHLLPKTAPPDYGLRDYDERLRRLATTPANAQVNCIEIVRLLRHAAPWSLQQECCGDWWQHPTTDGWDDADDHLDLATGGRYRRSLQRIDELQKVYGRAVQARRRAVTGQHIAWPTDSEIFQYGGARSWGPFVQHRSLVDQRFLDTVGSPEELDRWGATLNTVRVVDKQGQRRDPEYQMLGARTVITPGTPAPTDAPALARDPGLGDLHANTPAREVLQPLFPRTAEWEPLDLTAAPPAR